MQAQLNQSEYAALLKQKALIPDPAVELNWSGRGQHVEFGRYQPIPLEYIAPIGVSLTAKVDKVRCRRIILARKSMKCSRKLSLSDALVEAEHLHNLRHAHIFQLVGTYLQHRDFAILLYPAADCDLSVFMSRSNWPQLPLAEDPLRMEGLPDHLSDFLPCLASALDFVHDNTTRHCDIKPSNILVKYSPTSLSKPYNVYLADFGISQSFVSQDHSQTESSTGRTPRYCAPEVYEDLPYSRKADIFSLGCVFAEMYTVIAGRELDDFEEWRRGNGPNDYFHANIPETRRWIAHQLSGVKRSLIGNTIRISIKLAGSSCILWRDIDSFPLLLEFMLERKADMRPTAKQVSEAVGLRDCCIAGPEAYVAG